MNEVARNTESEGAVLQIRKIGNSLGLILSKELLARLKLKEGDKLHVVEHAKAMEIARRSFRTYADTYKALAE
jgi:antitoxin component of MazEF toxin-antitoxin module